jgi:hypothetical protein
MATPGPSSRLTPAIYEALVQRRVARDTMMWQAPVLSLTAQAFLFTIALSAGTSPAARYLAAILAIVVSGMSIQLMCKHRYYRDLDDLLLRTLEENEELTCAVGVPPHARREKLQEAAERLGGEPLPRRGLLAGWEARIIPIPSSTVWLIGLALFGAAAVAVLLLTAISPATLK